jgi:hypothetical protein
MNGLVLDKKRLRTMMAGVFTVFATVVPFLLSLYSANSEAVAIYGQIANDTAIYAYRCAYQNDQILHSKLSWHCNHVMLRIIALIITALSLLASASCGRASP